MAFITEVTARDRAARSPRLVKRAGEAIFESAATASNATFDVFLSHSSAEPEEILLGVKRILEDRGLRIYVDKFDDPHLSPASVTPATAEVLRGRMRQSKSLLYVHSQHSKMSRWMPWELGFFDGSNGKVGIIPVLQNQHQGFKGEEYLGLYPYVEVHNAVRDGVVVDKDVLWIKKSDKEYAQLKPWLINAEHILKRA